MPVDPDTQKMLDAIEAAGAPPIFDGTDPVASREAYLVAARAAEQGLDGIATEDRTLAGTDLGARVYTPAERSPGTVVFFHGGGWVVGDLDSHDRFCARIARDTGATVVSVDYRLAPEHPFPTPYEDCWAALLAVAADVESFGGGKIAVAGDSAGGNLAAAIAQRARDEQQELAAALLLYPAVDLEGDYLSKTQNATGYRLTKSDMDAFERAYAGSADRTDPRMSPLYGDPSGLCPTIVAVAGYDPLRDEGTAYAEVLEKAGVDVTLRAYPDFIHGFFGMAWMSPACDAAAAELTADLAKYLR
ncbi:alpha/beta hydrolase [Cumulibacter manganitolerans]|uniref:alpha/beta hydrolase n=1 Tax=Cumulibacter manganitolerans TaxID=1884992 RepID=UPI0012956FD2|nr:alpha/beta hydrolase [Cumulibacter manganitolerans]